MEILRLFDILDRYVELYPDKETALAGKDLGEWRYYSTKRYKELTDLASFGFLALDVKPGDKIATITFNRPEWNILDFGIQQIGAIHIPIYPTISDSDYEYILKHAEVKYIFVAGKEMYRRIEHLLPLIPSLKAVYTFKNINGVRHLSELYELGRTHKNIELLENLKKEVQPDDTATIIYTSGTTGNPKGVMLSHRNIISNVLEAAKIPPYDHNAKVLSFLPLCHVYERMMNYMYQYKGFNLYYCDNMAIIADYISEVKPHIICTVPRLLEKIYEKILSKGNKLKGYQKKIFDWSLRIGFRYELQNQSLSYRFQLWIARKLVFSKWKAGLGGNLDLVVSGGAALQPRLARIFWAAGIRVLEGYGLTETSPVISVTRLTKGGVKFGSVGHVFENVQVQIASDGEILCKGPSVMKGYYKEPEMTAESIDSNGWFHTGDIGNLDSDGHLHITDRKKLIFKTSFGKYISPQVLENKLKESIYIDQVMVLGENQKFAGALIAPNLTNLRQWAIDNHIKYETFAELIRSAELKKMMQNEINHYNTFFGETEQIKKFEICNNEWTVETGEMSATLKIRRSTITKKYASLIDKIFPPVE